MDVLWTSETRVVEMIASPAHEPQHEAQNEKRQKLPPPPPLQSSLYDVFWGLHKADLYVPPQKICHTGAVIVGVDGEIMVVNEAQKNEPTFRQFTWNK